MAPRAGTGRSAAARPWQSPPIAGELPHRAEHEAVLTSPLRLPGAGGRDRAAVGDERQVRRLVHVDGRPVVLEVRRIAPDRLHLQAHGRTAEDARTGLERVRFWVGCDDDVRPFLERFADDARIGRSVREAPWLRPYRRPMPFEVLACAVCEQLIDDERARAIVRKLLDRHGLRAGGLVDFPDAATVAGVAPAELERAGLAGRRALALRRLAREVAAGRVELLDPARREDGWRRLRAIPGIGSWTVSVLALHGQGQLDALPAGDHAYRVLVGRERGGAPASEEEVAAFLEPYRPWRGIAGWHLLRAARHPALTPRGRG